MLLEVLVYSDLIYLDNFTSTCKQGLLTVYNGRFKQQKSKARKVCLNTVL